MDKSIYKNISDIVIQFIKLNHEHNLIWNRNSNFSAEIFNEAGFDIDDWSWYDGHLVVLRSKQYPEIKVVYAACANGYEFSTDEILVCVHEGSPLNPSTSKTKQDLQSVSVVCGWKEKDCEADISELLPKMSNEFQDLVSSLRDLQLSFVGEDEQYYCEVFTHDDINPLEF